MMTRSTQVSVNFFTKSRFRFFKPTYIDQTPSLHEFDRLRYIAVAGSYSRLSGFGRSRDAKGAAPAMRTGRPYDSPQYESDALLDRHPHDPNPENSHRSHLPAQNCCG
jgi:hypothetical protein